MNLEETLRLNSIAAGGPGSGRHPGETKPSADEWTKMSQQEKSTWKKARVDFLKKSGFELRPVRHGNGGGGKLGKTNVGSHGDFEGTGAGIVKQC
jgi:hypothetical protein